MSVLCYAYMSEFRTYRVLLKLAPTVTLIITPIRVADIRNRRFRLQ